MRYLLVLLLLSAPGIAMGAPRDPVSITGTVVNVQGDLIIVKAANGRTYYGELAGADRATLSHVKSGDVVLVTGTEGRYPNEVTVQTVQLTGMPRYPHDSQEAGDDLLRNRQTGQILQRKNIGTLTDAWEPIRGSSDSRDDLFVNKQTGQILLRREIGPLSDAWAAIPAPRSQPPAPASAAAAVRRYPAASSDSRDDLLVNKSTGQILQRRNVGSATGWEPLRADTSDPRDDVFVNRQTGQFLRRRDVGPLNDAWQLLPVPARAQSAASDTLEYRDWRLPRSHRYEVYGADGRFAEIDAASVPVRAENGESIYDRTAGAWVNRPETGRNPEYLRKNASRRNR